MSSPELGLVLPAKARINPASCCWSIHRRRVRLQDRDWRASWVQPAAGRSPCSRSRFRTHGRKPAGPPRRYSNPLRSSCEWQGPCWFCCWSCKSSLPTWWGSFPYVDRMTEQRRVFCEVDHDPSVERLDGSAKQPSFPLSGRSGASSFQFPDSGEDGLLSWGRSERMSAMIPQGVRDRYRTRSSRGGYQNADRAEDTCGP